MKIVDVFNPGRVKRPPDKVISLLSSKKFVEHGFVIQKVELRQYIEKKDDKLGNFMLITSYVDTDKGSIETTYDEGYLGDDSLEKITSFLTSNLGISGLILRSIISLREEIKKSNSLH